MQQAIEQHRSVAVRQHKAVAIGPGGVGGVVAKMPLPERNCDVRHAHRHARMAGFRGLHGVHRQRANRVRELGVRSFLGYLGIHAKGANYTQRMRELPFSSPAGYEQLCSRDSPCGGHWFVFRGADLLVELGPPDPNPPDDPRVRHRPSWARLPLRENHEWLGREPLRTLYLGRLDGVDCWAVELETDTPAPAGMGWQGLRALFSVLDDAHFALAGRAAQLI